VRLKYNAGFPLTDLWDAANERGDEPTLFRLSVVASSLANGGCHANWIATCWLTEYAGRRSR
jgi:hypothetical protein